MQEDIISLDWEASREKGSSLLLKGVGEEWHTGAWYTDIWVNILFIDIEL